MDKIRTYLAAIFCNLGISANFLTLLSLFFSGVSGALIFQGWLTAAAATVLLSGFFDLMDGSVARLTQTADAFGGVLDSFLDRYGDAFILGGILFFYVRHGNMIAAVLAFSALVGSFAISYARARAECEIDSCRVGFWERGERIVFLALGLLFHNLIPVLWVLGIGTHVTAMQRLFFAKQKKSLTPQGRRHPIYLAKVGFLIALVILFKKT